MTTASIVMKDVHVDFPIYNGSSRSIRSHVFRAVGGNLSSYHNKVLVNALSGITLSVSGGERVGLIGHNGAGKSTMLRLLAGVYKPTAGLLSISGSRSALTDIFMGMDPELSGRENIICRQVFMGCTFRQAKLNLREIADFSELGGFLDLPMRTYSTGMSLRLAFAIATSVIPDILILDEMISAGDASFQEKARARTRRFVDTVKIMVIATHDLGLLREYCSRCIWMHGGTIRMDGLVEEVLSAYLAHPGNN